MLRALLDLVFPPSCTVCRRGGPDPLCPDCFSQIKFMKPHLGVHCAAEYQGVMRDAIHQMKFRKKRKLAEPLGVLMVKYISRSPALAMEEVDCLVPVPLHRRRLRERGFNQAELLGKVVSRYYEKPVVNALVRVKDTRAQFALPRAERLTNIKGAFRVADYRAVEKKNVLLVDDIYTTGATLSECGRMLKAAGASRIEILSLSRAVEN